MNDYDRTIQWLKDIGLYDNAEIYINEDFSFKQITIPKNDSVIFRGNIVLAFMCDDLEHFYMQ